MRPPAVAPQHDAGCSRMKDVVGNGVLVPAGSDLDVVVEDPGVDAVVAAIESSARTGEIGDGKIVVTAAEQVVRIRTGERGSEAI